MLRVSPLRLRSVLAPALTAGLFLLALTAASPSVAATATVQATVKGQATLTLGSGRAGKALKRQRVKLAGIGSGRVRALAGKRFRVVLPAGQVNAATGTAVLRGGFAFKRGRRTLPARAVTVKVKGKTLRVTAKLGGKKLRLFTGRGRVSRSNGSVVRIKVAGGRLKLTAAAARTVTRKLKLKRRVPAAAYGSLALNASRPGKSGPSVDPPKPALDQCRIAVKSELTGSLPAAAPLPTLSAPKQLEAGTPAIVWGFKTSFRGYIAGSGSLHAVNGAGRAGASSAAEFTFPVRDGRYSAGDPASTVDDRAVINGRGSAVFCNPGHGFGIAISNPTVVIDGGASRLIAEVETNYFGIHTAAQRIDLASLEVDDLAPFFNRSGSEVTWRQVPASLTGPGAESFCEPASEGRPGQCSYSEGEPVDPLTASAHTAYDTGNGSPAAWDALALYTKNSLPFPLPNATDGGCTLPEAAGGDRDQARTIDEYLTYNATHATPNDPPSFPWVDGGARPAARPDLDGGVAVTGGGLDWGVIPGLRSSVSGNGEFNLAGGATASQPWYGQGGSEGGPTGYSQKVGAPTAYFTWPAATGTYRDSGSKKQLVLRAAGRVAICNTKLVNPFWMGYGTVISNPTVVIDGSNSRITADVATRYRLSWVRGTVDVAAFDAADAGFNENTTGGTTTVEWELPTGTDGKTKMTAAGSTVLRMLSTNYEQDWNMQNPTVRASFPAGG